MERLCLDCHHPIKGRTDKKFCDDYCRNHYNNNLNLADGQLINRINQILRKNRNILKTAIQQGIHTISCETLLMNGFNFHFHTHFIRDDFGKTSFYCYEFGYQKLSDEIILLPYTLPLKIEVPSHINK